MRGGPGAPASTCPEQPPPRAGVGAPARQAPGPVPPYRGGKGAGGERGGRGGRIVKIIALLIAVVLILTIGMYFYLNSKLIRANVLVNYAGRPVTSAGQNWLLT